MYVCILCNHIIYIYVQCVLYVSILYIHIVPYDRAIIQIISKSYLGYSISIHIQLGHKMIDSRRDPNHPVPKHKNQLMAKASAMKKK